MFQIQPKLENGAWVITNFGRSISHWGKRAMVDGWETHDAVRGANLFGVSELSNAWVNAVSGNTQSQ